MAGVCCLDHSMPPANSRCMAAAIACMQQFTGTSPIRNRAGEPHQCPPRSMVRCCSVHSGFSEPSQLLAGVTPSFGSVQSLTSPLICREIGLGSALLIIMATQKVLVRLMFGSTIKGSGGDLVDRQIEVKADGSDTLSHVKELIAVSW